MIKCFYWYGPLCLKYCTQSHREEQEQSDSSVLRWSALNSICVWWTGASVIFGILNVFNEFHCITHTVQNLLFYTWLWLAIGFFFYYCPLNCSFQLKNKPSPLLYWAEQYGETNAFVIFLIKLIMQFLLHPFGKTMNAKK